MWKKRNSAFFRVDEVHDQPAASSGRPSEERAMGKRIRKPGASHASERIALGELIHQRATAMVRKHAR
jgi:hypothetical protein